MTTTRALVLNAELAAEALTKGLSECNPCTPSHPLACPITLITWPSAGQLHMLGACLSEYWKQKKCMAEGCEPDFVLAIFTALQSHLFGCALAGAGGGFRRDML